VVKKFDWAGLLRCHPILSGLDGSHVACMLSEETSSEQHYDPGEVIIREGEVGDSFFLIGSGSVEVVLCGTAGQTIPLCVLLQGETFGEMGLFERRPRCATVRARETCVVLEVKGEELRRLGEAQPDVEFKVLLKVSERLRSNNERVLALHLKDVEGASRAKDEFLAMLGHELRNPLGAISVAIHVLEKESGPDDGTARLRGIIARQTRHLTRLVDDLLDVSRVVTGKIALHKRPEDLRELVRRVVSSFEELGRTARHVVAVGGEAVTVEADATRMEQVISNLLDNALKYTPNGGRVEIATAAEGGDAVLRVRDAGVGIDADMVPRIFDVFVQAEQACDRAAGGLGLGLTLVKRLVELHGGTVAASSAGPDRGSEFVVRMPRLPDAAMGSRRETDPRRGGRRIVIIEDNCDVRDALRFLLESWGHRVEEAETGPRGLEIIRASCPEIVLVDLGLPGLDGYAIAEAVRATPGGDGVLLVAITGYGGLQVRRRTKDVGFDVHLTKPVDLETLERIVHSQAAAAE
jgi:signal transduction histidine kinase/ActR/RegA family two-component response regulator